MENNIEEILSKTKRNIYVFSAVFSVIILILILLVVFLYYNNIKKNSDSMLSEKSKLFFLTDQVKEVEKFKNSYASYKPNFNRIDLSYVNSQNPADFYGFLEKTASDCKVSLKVSLVPDNTKKNNKSISFQLASHGTFLDILTFSEKLESGPYQIKIKSLSIKKASDKSAAPEKNSKASADASLQIEVYTK